MPSIPVKHSTCYRSFVYFRLSKKGHTWKDNLHKFFCLLHPCTNYGLRIDSSTKYVQGWTSECSSLDTAPSPLDMSDEWHRSQTATRYFCTSSLSRAKNIFLSHNKMINKRPNSYKVTVEFGIIWGRGGSDVASNPSLYNSTMTE